MPWRLDIRKDIVSDTYKSLHATVTTAGAAVGSGFHVTIEYRNGSKKHIYYRQVPLEALETVDNVRFEIFNPGGGHAATALTSRPAGLGLPYDSLFGEARASFIAEAKKNETSQVTVIRKQQQAFSLTDDFPPLG